MKLVLIFILLFSVCMFASETEYKLLGQITDFEIVKTSNFWGTDTDYIVYIGDKKYYCDYIFGVLATDSYLYLKNNSWYYSLEDKI